MPKNGAFDSTVQTYGRGVIRWRWLILLVTVLLVAAAASGGRFLWFDTDYRVFFSEDNPQLKTFDELQNVYGKNDNVLFVLAPAAGEVFTAPVLTAVEHLTEQAWQIPFATRVDSVTNFQHTRAEGDDLFVADLVSDAATQPPEVLQEARQVALNEPLLVNRLVSPSAHVTGVNVTLHFAGKSITEVPEVAAHARRLADEIRADYPDIQVYLTGLSMLNNAFSEAGLQDMQTLVPLMYLAMFVIMFWLLRSLTSTFGTLLIVGFSALSAMGLAGWMGTGLTPPSAQARHHDHDAGGGGQHSPAGHHAARNASGAREARSHCREPADQPAADLPHQPDHLHRLSQHELQRFAAVSPPGQHHRHRRGHRLRPVGAVPARGDERAAGARQAARERRQVQHRMAGRGRCRPPPDAVVRLHPGHSGAGTVHPPQRAQRSLPALL